MQKKTTLVVLAAGMGSRFGGLKQMAPFGPHGETIIDAPVIRARLLVVLDPEKPAEGTKHRPAERTDAAQPLDERYKLRIEPHVAVQDVAELMGDDALQLVPRQVAERTVRDADRRVTLPESRGKGVDAPVVVLHPHGWHVHAGGNGRLLDDVHEDLLVTRPNRPSSDPTHQGLAGTDARIREERAQDDDGRRQGIGDRRRLGRRRQMIVEGQPCEPNRPRQNPSGDGRHRQQKEHRGDRESRRLLARRLLLRQEVLLRTSPAEPCARPRTSSTREAPRGQS